MVFLRISEIARYDKVYFLPKHSFEPHQKERLALFYSSVLSRFTIVSSVFTESSCGEGEEIVSGCR
jgi:hypothetical protein